MHANDLRELQRPLKQRYRDDPATARIAARAEGQVDVSGVACRVTKWRSQTTAGLHAAAGGSGDEACSADLLLEALVACAGVTMSAVATAMEIPLHSAKVVAEGHWDARGTLGVDRAAPIGLTDIALRFEVDSDADDDALARLVSLTERYCVIAQTLMHPPTMTFGYLRTAH